MEYENAVIFHLITSVRHKIVCLHDGNDIPSMNEFIVLQLQHCTNSQQLPFETSEEQTANGFDFIKFARFLAYAFQRYEHPIMTDL